MLLRRNTSGQTVELGPIRDDSGAAITTGVSAFVNNSAGSGTLTHRSVGIWAYTFTDAETNSSIVALRLTAATGGIAETFATLTISATGVSAANVITISDVDGNNRQIANPGGLDDDPFELGLTAIADAVLDELLSGHTIAGSAGAALTSINTQAALINTGVTIQGSSPVATNGTISEIVIGDDYYAANGRSFSWSVPAVTGMSVADVTFWFGGKGQGDAAGSSWLVQGTVTDAGGGNWTVAAELPRSATVDCVPGFYNWSGAIHHNSNGRQITKVRKNKTNRTQLVQKFTSEES